MGRKKKDIKLEITQDDKDEDILYHRYEVVSNDRTIQILLSKECNNIFYVNHILNDSFIYTIDLIFDKLNYIGNEYKVYSYIKNNVICFTTIIDGNSFHNNFTLDNHILGTCFGVCIKNLTKYEYVDFDKYF